MAQNDIYKLVLTGSYLGESVSNVFWFSESVQGSDDSLALEELKEGFEFVMSADLLALANDSMTYNLITITRIVDGRQEAFPVTWVGLVDDASGANALPSYVAIAFRYNRVSAATRHGYKRYAGIADSMVYGNNLDGSFSNAADNLEDAMETVIQTGSGFSFSPAVVSRPVVLGANPSYYLPQTVTFNGVTTQNSRKA